MRSDPRGSFIALLLLLVWVLPLNAATIETFDGRSLIVHVPALRSASGRRALVIVLHGGLGNAQRIESLGSESAMNMDALADSDGFLVAYLNGTPVTRRFGDELLGWNAGGGCCGLAASANIDDVTYIQGAVSHLVAEYGIARNRVYGIGHSNGAMMIQRLLCETDLLAAAVAISGPLNLDADKCPAARGRHILALHGSEDRNVPVAGGRGTQGISMAVYNSEARSRQVFTDSGASYELQVIPGADHKLEDLDSVIRRTEHRSIAEKAAEFFGLMDRKS